MNIFSRLKGIDATSKSSIKNFMIRPLGMIMAAIYTPLLLNYLGTEANGVWASILSIITWINYCDLGIGNGLRNVLTRELTHKEFKKCQETVSTAYIVLTGISIIILILLMVMALFLDWNILLKTELNVKPMIIITFIFISVNFVLALSNSILYALQLSERVSIRSCFVQMLNIIGLLILEKIESGNLTHMAILFGSTTALVYLGNSISIFAKHKYLIPKFSSFDRLKISEICNFGLQFFIVQLTAVLIFSSHNMIVSYLFGAVEVTPINTANTVYAAGYSFMAALVVPFWSRTTQAIENGEFQWVRSAIKRVKMIALIFIAGFIFVAFIFKDISKMWLGIELDYREGVIASTCVFYIMEVVNLVYVQFYYGMGEIKPYVFLTILQALLIIPLSYFLSISLNIGVAGVKWSAAIILSITGILLPTLTNRRLSFLQKQFDSKL